LAVQLKNQRDSDALKENVILADQDAHMLCGKTTQTDEHLALTYTMTEHP